MVRWSPFIGLALALVACSEEAYELACQHAVLDNRPAYAEASPNFEHELDRTHVFSDGTGQSVTVFYHGWLGVRGVARRVGTPRRVRGLSCILYFYLLSVGLTSSCSPKRALWCPKSRETTPAGGFCKNN